MRSTDNQEQFLSIIQSNKGIIYKVANAYCSIAEDRKDIVQEIVLQLWRTFDHYNAAYKHSTWIYRIALNVAISFYRKESSRKKISNGLTDSVFDLADAEDPAAKEANMQLLLQFIGGLKELDKALMLLYLEERSYREIAEIIGITETNVATKLSRIKTDLKQKFSIIQNK